VQTNVPRRVRGADLRGARCQLYPSAASDNGRPDDGLASGMIPDNISKEVRGLSQTL
jgi:hypothetical protein